MDRSKVAAIRLKWLTGGSNVCVPDIMADNSPDQNQDALNPMMNNAPAPNGATASDFPIEEFRSVLDGFKTSFVSEFTQSINDFKTSFISELQAVILSTRAVQGNVSEVRGNPETTNEAHVLEPAQFHDEQPLPDNLEPYAGTSENETSQLASKTNCGVCHENCRWTMRALDPCGHFPYCYNCIEKMKAAKRSIPLLRRDNDYDDYIICPGCKRKVIEIHLIRSNM